MNYTSNKPLLQSKGIQLDKIKLACKNVCSHSNYNVNLGNTFKLNKIKYVSGGSKKTKQRKKENTQKLDDLKL